MGSYASAEQARERIGAALDAIDAAYAVLRDTSSDVVGNDFRVDVAERLETQDRTNRGLMYRFFAEIADPPDGSECIPAVREALRARLRVTPREIVRRIKLATRIRPRRSLTGPPVPPELAELAAAVEAGAVGEDHIRAVCHALDVLPACVSPTDVTEAERTLVAHARKLDAGIVVKLGQRIADYLNPDGLFTDDDRARRRALRDCSTPRPARTSKPSRRRYGPAVTDPMVPSPTSATSAHPLNAATTRSNSASKQPSHPANSGRTAVIPSPSSPPPHWPSSTGPHTQSSTHRSRCPRRRRPGVAPGCRCAI
jgi:hypothetical protein